MKTSNPGEQHIASGTGNVIFHENANLRQYPSRSQIQSSPESQLTIGDLHGNAIKLIYFLIQQNVLNISEDDYGRLVEIYEKNPEHCTRSDLKAFKGILDNAELNDVGTIRLIGDTLSDRGQNDYFTLLILKKLHESGKHVEIMFSNHDADALACYHDHDEWALVDVSQRSSWRNLEYFERHKLVDREEVISLMERHFLPNLKAISYTKNMDTKPPSITIYTHAPVGLETINAAAEKFGIPFRYDTVDDLCVTIDAINDKFNRKMHRQHYKPITGHNNIEATTEPLFALERLAWNRISEYASNIITEIKTHNYSLYFVHGHDGEIYRDLNGKSPHDSFRVNVTNLDSDFGKDGLAGGNYLALHSEDMPAPKTRLTELYMRYDTDRVNMFLDKHAFNSFKYDPEKKAEILLTIESELQVNLEDMAVNDRAMLKMIKRGIQYDDTFKQLLLQDEQLSQSIVEYEGDNIEAYIESIKPRHIFHDTFKNVANHYLDEIHISIKRETLEEDLASLYTYYNSNLDAHKGYNPRKILKTVYWTEMCLLSEKHYDMDVNTLSQTVMRQIRNKTNRKIGVDVTSYILDGGSWVGSARTTKIMREIGIKQSTLFSHSSLTHSNRKEKKKWGLFGSSISDDLMTSIKNDKDSVDNDRENVDETTILT